MLINPVQPRQAYSGNSGSVNLTAGSTMYLGLALMSATEALVYVPVPRSGTFRNLVISSGGSPGVGQTYTATLRNTLADTSLTCQITAGFNEASDLINSAVFAAKQRVCLKIVASASAASTNILWCVEFTPDPG